ncbi:MAG: hypothetical protein R3F37_13350 [Candidatus Competibacteraceae bacterium]
MENIVYMGKEENLDAELQSNGFRERLAQLGMRLVVKRDGWWDYREADLVLAIRSGYKLYLAVKPASKLLNAWIAGCPAILSPENGYRELRRSELDFFECSTADQVIGCIRTLREQPSRFEEMITNGLERAKEFSRNAITERWAEMLDGIVSERYAKWLVDERPTFLRKAELTTALLRRRVWGTQVSQTPRAGWWREALRPIRRASVLPGSLRAFELPADQGQHA